MTATITVVGTGASTSSSASLTGNADLTAAVGDMLYVLVSASNAGTAGANSTTTCVDSGGVNVYTKIASINFTPGGVANDGTTLSIFECPVTSAITNGTLTVSFSPNTPEKVFGTWRVQPGAGEAISRIAIDTTGSTGNTSTMSAPTVSVANGDTIFGIYAAETDDLTTGDTDTTNGNWSAIGSFRLTADGGADASCQQVGSQLKTVNATGDQSYAATPGAARDSARTYVIVRSAAAGGTAIVPIVDSQYRRRWAA